MRILVLGATGMLGHKMFQVLKRKFPNTTGAIRRHLSEDFRRKIELFKGDDIIESLNAADFCAVEKVLIERKPEFVINCVGIVKQHSQADVPIPSITLNALLPHKLAEICTQWGGRIVHFSTDCVFSGRRGGYTEIDLSDAEDLYGRTKFLGEVGTGNAVTLRTSMIGRELSGTKSLLEWLLSQNHLKVRGFKHAWYSGVTTNYLADLVSHLIESFPTLSGLYQVTGETISKYDLLCLLRDAYSLDIEVIPDETLFCDRSMKGDKFFETTGYSCPEWTELARKLAADPTPYDKWRF